MDSGPEVWPEIAASYCAVGSLFNSNGELSGWASLPGNYRPKLGITLATNPELKGFDRCFEVGSNIHAPKIYPLQVFATQFYYYPQRRYFSKWG